MRYARITLTANDGHELAAYRAEPAGAPRGGLVVVHEISGVNRHIREVTDRFAAEGYVAVAPSLFDRVKRNVAMGYDARAFAYGVLLVRKLDWFELMLDLGAAVQSVALNGRVGMVGYCFGGTVVWRAAAHLDGLACAVSYYGTRIVNFVEQAPRIPVLMHVGRRDASLPLEKVHEIGVRYPSVAIHEYDAGHGFNCDHRVDYDAKAAALALERTLAFWRAHVG